MTPKGSSLSRSRAIPGGGGRASSVECPSTRKLLISAAAFLLLLGAGSAQMDEPLMGQV